MQKIFILLLALFACPLALASQAYVKFEAEQKQQEAAQQVGEAPLSEIEGQVDQPMQIEGQVEGRVIRVAPAQPPLEQQLAERRLREAERAKKEKEEKEVKHEQANAHDDAQVKRELAAVAHNGDVAENQVEGANAQERVAMFRAQGPDYLRLGQRDSFGSSDPEPILQVKTYEQLRLEKHGHNQSFILVRVFDGNCAYYYDAKVFHEFINQGGYDVKNPHPPRSFLRDIKNQIHYFECKISGDEASKRILRFLCSYSQLTEDIRLGGALSKQFTSSGYTLPRVSLFERRNQGIFEGDDLAPRPWPAGWRARFVEAGKLGLCWIAPLALGLAHGFLNNWLALRAGSGLQRWKSIEAPWREWVTGLGSFALYFYWGCYMDRYVQLRGRLSVWAAVFFSLLGKGLLQEVGESFPLPGRAGQWRIFPTEIKPWDWNFSLEAALAPSYSYRY